MARGHRAARSCAAAAGAPGAAAAALLLLGSALPAGAARQTDAEPWNDWLRRFGHDDYRYPSWIREQMQSCECNAELRCREHGRDVDWSRSQELTWCSARQFLLTHMPAFDLAFLPPAISVDGESMLDDNIAFALMAWNASSLDPKPPIRVAMAYLLPYATLHEARTNWRPLFFAKYFGLVAGLRSSKAALEALIGGGVRIMSWTEYLWPGYSGQSPGNSYQLGPFAPSSAPPVIGPMDFVAYGYASCTGWAKFLSSALKAVGVPAREVGSPCWNTGDFAGLATENPNVTKCWSGGFPDAPGGKNLNDHTWVEYWDNEASAWRFVDVASSSTSQSTWFCGAFVEGPLGGCDCASNAGRSGRDHDILAPTWAPASSIAGGADGVDIADDDYEEHGGPVLDVGRDLVLSSGAAVSPLVWSPRLRSPAGSPLKNVGLRVVNRTEYYRCKPRPPTSSAAAAVAEDTAAAVASPL